MFGSLRIVGTQPSHLKAPFSLIERNFTTDYLSIFSNRFPNYINKSISLPELTTTNFYIHFISMLQKYSTTDAFTFFSSIQLLVPNESLDYLSDFVNKCT